MGRRRRSPKSRSTAASPASAFSNRRVPGVAVSGLVLAGALPLSLVARGRAPPSIFYGGRHVAAGCAASLLATRQVAAIADRYAIGDRPRRLRRPILRFARKLPERVLAGSHAVEMRGKIRTPKCRLA